MVGLITERDLEQAEECFPGIGRFLDALSPKPRTFLELLSLFEHWCDGAVSPAPPPPVPPRCELAR